ncbi:hypothetical protein C5167_050488 [Papaver somniferum]|uniref:Uncharacterized protein n=1 Tax=Papaver somniferum TaxID=3469 RepID=A0A4Y7KSC3_PAPSO|nr:hypothetical protein C5167_050488 [Papaver somniferum]
MGSCKAVVGIATREATAMGQWILVTGMLNDDLIKIVKVKEKMPIWLSSYKKKRFQASLLSAQMLMAWKIC